jgi:RimJ/RimL family protein N-acetyltransferase
MTAWLQTPQKGAAQIAALQSAVPVIHTERLTLRLPRLTDWPALEPIWTTEQGRHIGGPMTPEEAWLDFNHLVAGWILRGHGALTICRTVDDSVLGLITLHHEFGDPAPELGWLLTAGAEGHGYATEAAQALLPLCHDIYDDAFVSYIADGNDSSARVATRLGARRNGTHPLDADVAVYRYSKDRRAS